ncbi:MAG: L,D-transpeptidase family protein [Oceanospirillaceae bacterium]|nr:L,D-transpeptidase family protein [Oceanospirillaceae bacterium]
MKRFTHSCLCLLLTSILALPAQAQTVGGSAAAASHQHSQGARFASYQSAIDFYRQLADTYHWPAVIVTPVLRLGDRHPAVTDIRQRLILLGDLAYVEPGQEGDLFDHDLEQALIGFQKRHGLDPDGVWGPRTRAALEVKPSTRYRQLLLNRQRRQSFQAQLSPDGHYVQVNIPAYEMRYFEQGREVLRMRAIVGKLKARTPLVASEIRSLELNPDWNVPSGIAYRDIVPELEASPAYLDHKHLQLVEGYGNSMRVLSQWDLDFSRLYRGAAPQQRFWQAPGPENPLGQMKFNFPNDYQVYMHGTPNAYLFDRPVRNFSSGCIRLEYPGELARRLFGKQGLTAQGTWLFEDIIASGDNRIVRLPTPVAVYTTYWTAWLDENQALQFRDDIYDLDQQEFVKLESGELAGP